MVYQVEDLTQGKTYYILDSNIFMKKQMDYAVYKVFKTEKRGINRSFAHLKTNARNTLFPKSLNVVGSYIEFKGHSKLKIFESFDEMASEYCSIVRRDKDTNPELFKKLLNQYPEYFI